MEQGSGELLILTTLDDAEKAAEFARGLVDARLAACVSVLPGARSFYRWQSEEIREDAEHVLLIKTHRDKLTQVEKFFRDRHSYDCPEFLALDAAGISPAYRDWLWRELNLNQNSAQSK